MNDKFATPKGSRLQIGVFGRTNAGKSTLLNALSRQEIAIASETPGTTTDPVEKAIELSPLGPVLFVDTGGIDDESALGSVRIERTRRVLERVDVALIAVDATLGDGAWGRFEEELYSRITTPKLVVVNKVDAASPEALESLRSLLLERGAEFVLVSAERDFQAGLGVPSVREALTKLVPEELLSPPPLASDLVPRGSLVVLVAPIDKAAPKGRLILPQVQTIRDLLDGGDGCLVVQPDGLSAALESLKTPPGLVVTDSQAFGRVSEIVPRAVPLTSFSILFARQKGDLQTALAGARAIDALTEDSRVLIAEACAHHPVEEDIGTVKIPRALRKKIGEGLTIERSQGRDFPEVEELRRFDLVVHCGACVFNRREMTSRVARAASAGVPITNYGLTLAKLNGILDRAVEPFGV